MLRVGPGCGVLHRGNQLVAAMRDFRGSVQRGKPGSVSASYSGEIVGKPSIWCQPEVELRLTFLMNPRRPRSKRIAVDVKIVAVRDGRVILTGTKPWSNEGCYAADFPPEVFK